MLCRHWTLVETVVGWIDQTSLFAAVVQDLGSNLTEIRLGRLVCGCYPCVAQPFLGPIRL